MKIISDISDLLIIVVGVDGSEIKKYSLYV